MNKNNNLLSIDRKIRRVNMSLNWSLKELYETFEGENFQNDLKELERLLSECVVWTNENTQNHENESIKLEEHIHRQEEIGLLVDRLGGFASLTISVDSKNQEALKYEDIISRKLNVLAETDAKFSKWMSDIENLDSVIASSERFGEYRFYLKEIVEKSSHTLSEKEEGILARMRNTGSSSWTNYKNLLISTHKVEIELEGKKKELPLTMVLNLSHDKDKKVRKAAYHAEIASYKKIEDGLAAALNAIKGEVVATCELRNYKSPLDMTLSNSRMDKETLEAMLAAMKESLPMFRKYLRRKAELLGYENGLPFYELYAPVVEKDMDFDYEAGKAFVVKNFSEFSDHLADFATKAFDKNWVDVLPKEGKRGGAFCRNLRSIGESRIMLNYGGSLGSVITLAHELGHGFHGECLEGQSCLNTRYPMPLAETASTFCETIVKKAALKEASKEEAFAILETEIGDCTQVIVDIYSRFLFESGLFEKRAESPVSVNEIKEMMLDAQKATYGDGLDPEYLHAYMWTWKPHYYYSGSNFYNFPYAFGLLFAKGLYAEYIKRGEIFTTQYEELLALTGKNKIADVTKVMDIDVHDIEFWRSSLRIIGEDIEEFIRLSYEI